MKAGALKSSHAVQNEAEFLKNIIELFKNYKDRKNLGNIHSITT